MSPPKPCASSAVRAALPTTPSRERVASQDDVVQKEMADLQEIMLDSDRLCALVEAGLKERNLTDDTPTLERVAALSNRLLCRNRAREAAVRFGTALRVTKTGKTGTLDAAASAMWPAYFRHSRENDETGEDVYLSKLYLHGLPPGGTAAPGGAAAAGGTSLCVRFSLASRDEEEMYDLSLKVLQVHPWEQKAHHFHFSFELADRPANDAAGWVLDEVQRLKLVELQALLGLSDSLWTPVGVLGFVLAAASCAQLEARGHPLPCNRSCSRPCNPARGTCNPATAQAVREPTSWLAS